MNDESENIARTEKKAGAGSVLAGHLSRGL